MPRIESSIVVPNPVEDTFSFLNARERHLSFIPRMTALEQTSHGNFGQVGTPLKGILIYFGIHIPVRYRIIELESCRSLAMQGKMGPLDFEDGYILSTLEKGSQ